MKREPFEVVAMTPKQGAVIGVRRECKVFASNNFRKLPDRLFLIHLAVVIHEQPVVH
jgi:hypothetical protein